MMLKKIILTLVLLVFASVILFASVWRTSAQNLRPIESATPASEIEAGENAEEEEEKVEYDLVWPGILPDHFLYPVKMIRDRVWLWLTTDSLKKAELLLKFADKRIWSAQMLVDKGEVNLGISTASKAEKYLERAIDQTKVAGEKGEEVKSLWERLSRATLKHEEVLLDIGEKVSGNDKAQIDDLLVSPRRGYEEVEKILGE